MCAVTHRPNTDDLELINTLMKTLGPGRVPYVRNYSDNPPNP